MGCLPFTRNASEAKLRACLREQTKESGLVGEEAKLYGFQQGNLLKGNAQYS